MQIKTKIQVIIFTALIIGLISTGISTEAASLKHSEKISPAVYFQSGELVKVWVVFSDKGEIPAGSLDSLAQEFGISERAIERRAKVGVSIGIEDLPVSEDYCHIISPWVISWGKSSRWMNAAAVTVNRCDLLQVAEFPFVAEIIPVAKGKCAELFDWEESFSWQAADGYNESYAELGHEGAFYGSSYDQLEQIGVIEAHRRGLYGEGVIITIMDGGFLLDHRSMLHADVLAEWDFINDDPFTGYDPLQDIYAQPRHGTAVMSNIAAFDAGNLIGAAPYASFMLAKTEDVTGETPAEEDNMVAAIEWAEFNGTDVISTSLSYSDWYVTGDYDGIIPFASRAAQRAFEMGVVFVTSMGNAGPYPMTMGTPSDAEGALAVGAVDSTWNLTSFSSRGPTADGRIKPNILAMGRHVTVARPFTFDEYSLANGTSFSCPLAAGAIALIIQAHPDWQSWKIMEAVENTATRASHPDNDWGHGILRIDRALDYPSLSGRIINAVTNTPIPGAVVKYKCLEGYGTDGEITADSYGCYFTPNFAEGKYILIVKAGGYSDSEERTVILPPDEVCDFVLIPQR